jgi:hypothetical protein
VLSLKPQSVAQILGIVGCVSWVAFMGHMFYWLFFDRSGYSPLGFECPWDLDWEEAMARPCEYD